MSVNVRYIDVVPWKRPRHQRLRRIWRGLELYCEPAEIWAFMNPGRMHHAKCLQQIWEAHRDQEMPYLLITEMDFLPNLGTWLYGAMRDLERDGMECLAPVIERGQNEGGTAPWFMLFDMDQLRGRDLRFQHPRDPAWDLHEQIVVDHFRGQLRPGVHDGFDYRYGTHLMWGRHLHDPPDMQVGDVVMGEMQARHDKFVASWLARQSESFRRLAASLTKEER